MGQNSPAKRCFLRPQVTLALEKSIFWVIVAWAIMTLTMPRILSNGSMCAS